MTDTPWSSGDMLAELESLRRRAHETDAVRDECRHLQLALQDLERRQRAIFDEGPLVCLVLSSRGDVVDANRAAEQCLSLSHDELVGRSITDLVDHEHLPPGETPAALYSRSFSGEKEIVLRGRSGVLRHVRFASSIEVMGENEDVHNRLLVGVDVTRQKREVSSTADSDHLSMLESIPGAACAFDNEYRFVFANSAAGVFFRAEPDDLLGRCLREFLAENDWSRVLDNTADLGRAAERRYDLTITGADGETRAATFRFAMRRDGDGIPRGIVAAVQDVAEHRKVERALEESEVKYRSLFEESIDVVYITSKDGKLVDISPSAVSLFGYTREELIERDVHGLYADPNQRIQFQDVIEKQGFVRGFEITLLNKSGEEVNCLLTSTLRTDAEGNTLGYQGIIRNITERKRAEAARERERRTFRVIAEAAVRSSEISDLCSRILGGLVEVLGFDGGTLRIHDGTRGVLDPVAVAGLRDGEEDLILSQSIQTDQDCVASHVARTGEPVFAPDTSRHSISESHGSRLEALGLKSLVSCPVFGARRNLLAIMQLFGRTPKEMHEEEDRLFFETVAGMLGAVLERKMAEDEKREVQSQLIKAQKMEAIGTLASGVAHDFNNLLTAIQGFAELCLMSVDKSDRIHEDLEKIRSAADRGAGLVRQLLLFGREQPIQLGPVNINKTTRGMIKMLEPLIGEDIAVNMSLEPDPWLATADEGNIQQVLMNLAVNARDAMPEGGTLTVRTRNVTLTEVDVAGDPEARPGDFVCVSVEDSGSGMDPETIGRIFEPFFSTKGPGKGTGLGLSVVYGIVKQHGGWIYTLSTPRMGTTFEVYIPATTDQPATKPVHSDPMSEHPGAGERILVVEDEESVRELAATVLRKSGYLVREAATVAEALRVFNEEGGNFDLVFSDVVLPDRSGVQLVDDLMAEKPGLRVLMSSGHASNRSQWETITERGLPFIQKPYSLTGLLETVREAIRG